MLYHISRLILISLALTACSLFSPVQTEAAKIHVINTLPSLLSERKHATDITLLVTAPSTSVIYDTQQMVYVTQPYQLAYFAKNRWADTPTHMLHSLLIQTMQNTRAFHAVISSPIMGHYDLVLNTQLIKLQHSFLQQPSRVELLLNIQLVDPATARIKATHRIAITETAPENTPQGGVIATNRAVAKALQQIARFTLANEK